MSAHETLPGQAAEGGSYLVQMSGQDGTELWSSQLPGDVTLVAINQSDGSIFVAGNWPSWLDHSSVPSWPLICTR